MKSAVARALPAAARVGVEPARHRGVDDLAHGRTLLGGGAGRSTW
jgi:argininosuccinate synthase